MSGVESVYRPPSVSAKAPEANHAAVPVGWPTLIAAIALGWLLHATLPLPWWGEVIARLGPLVAWYALQVTSSNRVLVRGGPVDWRWLLMIVPVALAVFSGIAVELFRMAWGLSEFGGHEHLPNLATIVTEGSAPWLIIGAVVHELVFRGVVLPRSVRTHGVVTGTALTVAVNAAAGGGLAVVPFMCAIYLYTRSVRITTIVHVIAAAVATIGGVAVAPYAETWGPIGWLFGVAALALGFAFLATALKRWRPATEGAV